MIQLIVNRKNGYIYYKGESLEAAAKRWEGLVNNLNASWYEVMIKDTVFNNRGQV